MSFSVFGPGNSCLDAQAPGDSWLCARYGLSDALSFVSALACVVVLARKIRVRCQALGPQTASANYQIGIITTCLLTCLMNMMRFSSGFSRNPDRAAMISIRLNKTTYFVRMLIPLVVSTFFQKFFVLVLFQRQLRRCVRLVMPVHFIWLVMLVTAYIIAELDMLPNYASCRSICWVLLSGTNLLICLGILGAAVPVFFQFATISSALNARLISRMRRLFYLIVLCMATAIAGFVYDLTRLLNASPRDCTFPSHEDAFWADLAVEIMEIFILIWGVLYSFYESSPVSQAGAASLAASFPPRIGPSLYGSDSTPGNRMLIGTGHSSSRPVREDDTLIYPAPYGFKTPPTSTRSGALEAGFSNAEPGPFSPHISQLDEEAQPLMADRNSIHSLNSSLAHSRPQNAPPPAVIIRPRLKFAKTDDPS